MATNQHGRLGIAALVISVLALLCAQVLGSSQQIMGLVMAMIVGELLSMAMCFWLAATTFLSRDNKDQEALDESRAVHYR
jgi:hypothetical protein